MGMEIKFYKLWRWGQ